MALPFRVLSLLTLLLCAVACDDERLSAGSQGSGGTAPSGTGGARFVDKTYFVQSSALGACEGVAPNGERSAFVSVPVGEGGQGGTTRSGVGPGGAAPSGAAGSASSGGRVCGCDGQSYASEDAALASGTEVDAYGYCEVSPAEFGCGPLRCLIGKEGCYRESSEAEANRYHYECVPLGACADAFEPEDVRRCDCFVRYDGLCRAVPTSVGLALYESYFVGR